MLPNIVFAWKSLRIAYQKVSTASLVSQLFSRAFCGKWDSLLAKILLRVSLVSCEGKNAIYCEARESRNFKISIDSRESRYKISVCETRKKQVSLPNLSARLARSESRYKISVCEPRKKRVLLQNLSARRVRSESHYEISVCETRESCESRENLPRMLGLKSESRFSREFQKVILMSTLIPKFTRLPWASRDFFRLVKTA